MVRQNGVPIDSLQIEAQKKRIVKGMIGAAVAAIGAVFTTQYVFSSCFNKSPLNIPFLMYMYSAVIGGLMGLLLFWLSDWFGCAVGGMAGGFVGELLQCIILNAEKGTIDLHVIGFQEALIGLAWGSLVAGVIGAGVAYICILPSTRIFMFGITAAILGAYPITFLATLCGILSHGGIKYMGPQFGLQAALDSPFQVTYYGFLGGFLVLALLGIAASSYAKWIGGKHSNLSVLLAIAFSLIGDMILIFILGRIG